MSVMIPVLEGAACTEHFDKDFFFPSIRETNRRARHVQRMYCDNCPVYAKCLKWAVESEDEQGIWAGTTPEQRKAMRK